MAALKLVDWIGSIRAALLMHLNEEPAQEGPNRLFSNELEFQDGDTGMHSGRVLVHITHILDKASLSLLRFTEAVLQRLSNLHKASNQPSNDA